MQQAQKRQSALVQGSGWAGMQVDSSCPLSRIPRPCHRSIAFARQSQHVDADDITITVHGMAGFVSKYCTVPLFCRCSKLPHRCASCKMAALDEGRCWFVPHTVV